MKVSSYLDGVHYRPHHHEIYTRIDNVVIFKELHHLEKKFPKDYHMSDNTNNDAHSNNNNIVSSDGDSKAAILEEGCGGRITQQLNTTTASNNRLGRAPSRYVCDTCHGYHRKSDRGDAYIQGQMICKTISKATTKIIKQFQEEVDNLQNQITELKREMKGREGV